MIVTLTLDPSLDRTVILPGPLPRGAASRLGSVTVESGGKGVNVARVLASSSQGATALVPAMSDDSFLRAIDSLGLLGPACRAALAAEVARINTAVTEPDGTMTKPNESGAGLSEVEVAAVEAVLSEELCPAPDGRSWAVPSGPLPPGAPVDRHVRLISLLRPLGVRIAVDASGAPLTALAADLPDCAPDPIKPNGQEPAQLAGRGATDLEDIATAGGFGPVVEAACILVKLGIGIALATLGPAGSALVTGESAWHAATPSVPIVPTAGAGDSSIAGFILADVRGGGQIERLRTAMTYGPAAASPPGTVLPALNDLLVQASEIARLN